MISDPGVGMQIRALKIFSDVVALRSFSRAAEENGISQSGVSQVVHQLEERLGARLIDRSKRPFLLTEEGKIYCDGCRRIIDEYTALEDRVRVLHSEVAGRVRVASIYSVGLHHMSWYMQEFMRRFPRTHVRLEYLHPHMVYRAVNNGNADLGLISYPKSSRSIDSIPWRKEPMVLVCAPGNRFAGRDLVALEDLGGERLVGFSWGLTIRREIERTLQERDVDVDVVMEFDNIETIKRAIEIDVGVALLPEPTVRREVEGGTLAAVPLDTDDLVRPLAIIRRRGAELGVAAQRFVDLLLADPMPADPPDRHAPPDGTGTGKVATHATTE